MTIQKQRELFEQLEEACGSKNAMVKVLLEILPLTKDSIYRRINADTELRIVEFHAICKRFGISMDAFLEMETPATTFFLPHDFGDSNKSEIMGSFEHLVTLFSRLAKDPASKITYFSMELPVFHIMEVPELLAFKLYYWESIRTRHTDYRFNLDRVIGQMQQELDLIRRITSLYNQITTREIIYKESFSSVLTQLNSYLAQGRFENPQEVLVLFDRLLELVDHLKNQARIGQKYTFDDPPPTNNSGTNYDLFYNDSIFSQNAALVESSAGNRVYLEHNVINLLYATDINFFRYTEDRLETIIAKSNMISRYAEATRNSYFSGLREDVQKAKEKAQRWLDGK